MKIDITRLIQNQITRMNVSGKVDIPKDYLDGSMIDELENVNIDGKVTNTPDGEIELTGTLTGVMTLKDDITLEPVKYNFEASLEETLEKDKNLLDITDLLWQNILVEVPSKVRATSEDIELSGDGWRVISEETYNKERNNMNNPFANLDELLKIKEDK